MRKIRIVTGILFAMVVISAAGCGGETAKIAEKVTPVPSSTEAANKTEKKEEKKKAGETPEQDSEKNQQLDSPVKDDYVGGYIYREAAGAPTDFGDGPTARTMAELVAADVIPASGLAVSTGYEWCMVYESVRTLEGMECFEYSVGGSSRHDYNELFRAAISYQGNQYIQYPGGEYVSIDEPHSDVGDTKDNINESYTDPYSDPGDTQDDYIDPYSDPGDMQDDYIDPYSDPGDTQDDYIDPHSDPGDTQDIT